MILAEKFSVNKQRRTKRGNEMGTMGTHKAEGLFNHQEMQCI